MGFYLTWWSVLFNVADFYFSFILIFPPNRSFWMSHEQMFYFLALWLFITSNMLSFILLPVLTRMCLYSCAPWPSPLCRVLSISSSPATGWWSADVWRREPNALECVWEMTWKGGCLDGACVCLCLVHQCVHPGPVTLLVLLNPDLQTTGACWRSVTWSSSLTAVQLWTPLADEDLKSFSTGRGMDTTRLI